MRLFALAILLLFTATAQAERFFGELDAVSEPVLGARTGLIEEMDRDSLRVNADAGTSVELPTQCVSSALMARSHTRFSALFPATAPTAPAACKGRAVPSPRPACPWTGPSAPSAVTSWMRSSRRSAA
ncbi:hypothetical protein HML84_03185 [Alcanivorax sp. IO_7]|nr:hypothetical protein HML84_03185 [Alcanivorax sp. IO_7]